MVFGVQGLGRVEVSIGSAKLSMQAFRNAKTLDFSILFETRLGR